MQGWGSKHAALTGRSGVMRVGLGEEQSDTEGDGPNGRGKRIGSSETTGLLPGIASRGPSQNHRLELNVRRWKDGVGLKTLSESLNALSR